MHLRLMPLFYCKPSWHGGQQLEVLQYTMAGPCFDLTHEVGALQGPAVCAN